MINELIQLAASLIGSLCFGILFNIRGKRLISVTLGGLMSWGLFLIMSLIIPNEPINYFLVAFIISVYCEIMARVLKTPAAPLITTSLIPLIPGGSLYYTMSCAFDSDFDTFLEKALSTLKFSSALALGIIIATTISQLMMRGYAKKH